MLESALRSDVNYPSLVFSAVAECGLRPRSRIKTSGEVSSGGMTSGSTRMENGYARMRRTLRIRMQAIVAIVGYFRLMGRHAPLTCFVASTTVLLSSAEMGRAASYPPVNTVFLLSLRTFDAQHEGDGLHAAARGARSESYQRASRFTAGVSGQLEAYAIGTPRDCFNTAGHFLSTRLSPGVPATSSIRR